MLSRATAPHPPLGPRAASSPGGLLGLSPAYACPLLTPGPSIRPGASGWLAHLSDGQHWECGLLHCASDPFVWGCHSRMQACLPGSRPPGLDLGRVTGSLENQMEMRLPLPGKMHPQHEPATDPLGDPGLRRTLAWGFYT